MEYETSRILDVEGSKYRVGWDEYGYFTLEPVMHNPETDEWERQRDINGDKVPWMNFSPEEAKKIAEEIGKR